MMINIPTVGEIYYDCDNRKLEIKTVDVRDPLGRQVVGILNDNFNMSYTCDIITLEEIWRDRTQKLDPSEIKI